MDTSMQLRHLKPIETFFCKIPYRDREFALLSQKFMSLITDVTPQDRKVVIMGEPSLDKTETIKEFVGLLESTAKAASIKLYSLYIDGREDLLWDFHLQNNLSLGKIPENIRFILILDHLEQVTETRARKMMGIIRRQKMSVIGIINKGYMKNLNILHELTHSWERIKFSTYAPFQIVDGVECYCRDRFIPTHNLTKVFHKIASHSNGSLKKALYIFHEAEKLAVHTTHKTVNEQVIDLLISDFSLEWRPVNLLPEDVAGF
jgi:Cdc6-like AAA superfamily ATPase